MLDRPSVLRRHDATMRLRAVRSQGEVVDFVWDYASDAAAALLRCTSGVVRGRYLCAWQDAGPPEQMRLIHRYRRILERGHSESFEHVHEVNGRADVVFHRVVLEGDGVAVTLINLSADRRAQVARLRIDDVAPRQHAAIRSAARL